MVRDISVEGVAEEVREEDLKCEYCRNNFTMAEWDDHLEGICRRDGRQQSNYFSTNKKELKNLIFVLQVAIENQKTGM
jgi:Cdc6-like AAA superfamily ATPase